MRLADFDPNSMADFGDEQQAQVSLEKNAADIADYQDMLMAHETNGLLIIFQAMDGAGKDATIKNVMSNLDPQGCEMKMFKAPSEKEVKHDYLWRAAQSVPARGQIGIFNRSYYEHVIVERIHPEKLARQDNPSCKILFFHPKDAEIRKETRRKHKSPVNFSAKTPRLCSKNLRFSGIYFSSSKISCTRPTCPSVRRTLMPCG